MKLCCEVILSASFMHKQSGQILDVDKIIKKEYDECSAEYKILCVSAENDIGFKREQNEDKFDKALLSMLTETMKKSVLEVVQKITDSFKTICEGNEVNGWIEFGGWILNAKDYSAICVKDIKTNISKK